MPRLSPIKHALICASLLLVTGCSTASPPELPATVGLASWNLEHLAERNGTGCRPRTDADYEALRVHAERLDAHVVALQEVENAAAAARIFTPDRWTIVMSDRPGMARDGYCRGEVGPNILKQDVGFAIRKGIPFRRNPDVSGLGLGDPDLRWGVDIIVDLPRPIRLLSIHLKSGCNSGRDPEDPDCAIIFAQATALENWIDERARTGEDFAILGDWNRRTAVFGDAFLAEVSDDQPPGGRIIMADAGQEARCIARYRDFIDHIALGGRTAQRLVPGSFLEYAYEVPEHLYPSDHCPLRVEISR